MTDMISFRPTQNDLDNIGAVLDKNPHLRGNRSSAISLALDRLANGHDGMSIFDLLDAAYDKVEARLSELFAIIDEEYDLEFTTDHKKARDERHLALSHEYIELEKVKALVSQATSTLPSERLLKAMANPNSDYWQDHSAI